MKRRTIVAALGVALIIGASACGGGGTSAADKAVEKPSGGKVKANGKGGLTVTANGSQANLGSSDLPKDFPTADVPVPGGGELIASASTPENGKQVWLLTYKVSGGDTSSVVSGYQSKLKDAGYAIGNGVTMGSGNGSIQSFAAIGAKWDVNVAGASAASGDAGFYVTVSTHDTTNDTTTTSG